MNYRRIFCRDVLGGVDFGNRGAIHQHHPISFADSGYQSQRYLLCFCTRSLGQYGIEPVAIGRQPAELVAPYREPRVPAAECSAQNCTQLDADVLQSGQYPLTRRLVIVKQNR